MPASSILKQSGKSVRLYRETARGRREQFNNRSLTLVRKGYEVSSICGAKVLVVVEKDSKLLIFNSNNDGPTVGGIDLDTLLQNPSPELILMGPKNFEGKHSEHSGQKFRDDSEEEDSLDQKLESELQRGRPAYGDMTQSPASEGQCLPNSKSPTRSPSPAFRCRTYPVESAVARNFRLSSVRKLAAGLRTQSQSPARLKHTRAPPRYIRSPTEVIKVGSEWGIR